jgi:hypothetical protein
LRAGFGVAMLGVSARAGEQVELKQVSFDIRTMSRALCLPIRRASRRCRTKFRREQAKKPCSAALNGWTHKDIFWEIFRAKKMQKKSDAIAAEQERAGRADTGNFARRESPDPKRQAIELLE